MNRPLLTLTAAVMMGAAGFTGFSAAPAVASTEQAQPRKPLLIVRFNQRAVYYQNSLTLAVAKAEAAKPGVVYNITSYVPSGASEADAQNNVNAIISTMVNMGVSKDRIQLAKQTVAPEFAQEVHIAVY